MTSGRDPAMVRDVVLTVFMEGTANPMHEVTTQIALFSRLCAATELPCQFDAAAGVRVGPGHHKLCFPGCGVTHGVSGTLFATGLTEQCRDTRGYVEAAVQAGLTVQVNFVGLSRGGIGGLYLAQELKDLPRDKVLLNLLLFDPVPGNFVWMASFLDWAGVMNANKAMNVADVRNLGRVVVLYPHEPLPDIAVHAPLLATFPEGCALEQDVILGCHQGALWMRPQADTCLSFALIRDFLLDCGSQLRGLEANPQRYVAEEKLARSLNVSPRDLASMLDDELRRRAPTARIAHAPERGTLVVRHETGTYLDRSHEALLDRLGEPRRAKGQGPFYMLDFQ